jgi:hypothetical protein
MSAVLAEQPPVQGELPSPSPTADLFHPMVAAGILGIGTSSVYGWINGELGSFRGRDVSNTKLSHTRAGRPKSKCISNATLVRVLGHPLTEEEVQRGIAYYNAQVVPSGNPNYDAAMGAALFLALSAHGNLELINRVCKIACGLYNLGPRP